MCPYLIGTTSADESHFGHDGFERVPSFWFTCVRYIGIVTPFLCLKVTSKAERIGLALP